MQVLFSQKAYNIILRECVSHKGKESGGILVGKKMENSDFVVAFAIGSGPGAERSRFRFTPDVAWQQRILDKLFRLYSVSYLGSFHRHIGFNHWPSSVDSESAHEIISNPDWNTSEAIFPIVNFNDGIIQIYPYYFSQKHNDFQLICWTIIPNKSHLLKSALQRRNK
jgi:integrative and conjugative element protein (TIGR02256 family)